MSRYYLRWICGGIAVRFRTDLWRSPLVIVMPLGFTLYHEDDVEEAYLI